MIFGDIGNEGVASLTDIGMRECVILAILAVAVLVLGVWPAPLVEVMDATVMGLLDHVMQSKL